MTVPSAFNGFDGHIEVKTPCRNKIEGWKNPETVSKFNIIDIRHDAVEINLKDEILTSLKPNFGPKKLPTLLLYDERGLQLFEEVNLGKELRNTVFRLTGS
jgi:hypothetical protein